LDPDTVESDSHPPRIKAQNKPMTERLQGVW
jgi:hypothetical protein